MDIFKEEFYSCHNPNTRLSLYYQLNTVYYRVVLKNIEYNAYYNLYFYLYTDSHQKEALIFMDNVTHTKLLTQIADNKARISAFNLIND